MLSLLRQGLKNLLRAFKNLPVFSAIMNIEYQIVVSIGCEKIQDACIQLKVNRIGIKDEAIQRNMIMKKIQSKNKSNERAENEDNKGEKEQSMRKIRQKSKSSQQKISEAQHNRL
jgi:ABC-type microcin C transport system permease subunit YejB